jgi:MerR family transcriptional regulator, redox-sensitive transcriptional activator SoxR
MSELLPISEVVRRSGVAFSALRFYEQRSLISSEREGRGRLECLSSGFRGFDVVRDIVRISIGQIPPRLAGLELDPRPGLQCKARRRIITPCASSSSGEASLD